MYIQLQNFKFTKCYITAIYSHMYIQIFIYIYIYFPQYSVIAYPVNIPTPFEM
jgi:hypothetical protein